MCGFVITCLQVKSLLNMVELCGASGVAYGFKLWHSPKCHMEHFSRIALLMAHVKLVYILSKK